MLKAILFSLAAFVAFAVWVLIIRYLGFLTTPEVEAWKKVAALRGYTIQAPSFENAVGKFRIFTKLQQRTDIERMLAIAGRPETGVGLWTKALRTSSIVLAVGIVLDFVGYWSQGTLLYSLWGPVVIAIVLGLLTFSKVNRQAKQNQQAATRAIVDSLMIISVLAGQVGLNLDDALVRLSRCMKDKALNGILDNDNWRRLVTQEPNTTPEKYRFIGRAYGVKEFSALSDALLSTEIGITPTQAYSQLATMLYKNRLYEAKSRSAKAKTLVIIPVAGMLIPLLILIGAPLVYSVTNSLK